MSQVRASFIPLHAGRCHIAGPDRSLGQGAKLALSSQKAKRRHWASGGLPAEILAAAALGCQQDVSMAMVHIRNRTSWNSLAVHAFVSMQAQGAPHTDGHTALKGIR